MTFINPLFTIQFPVCIYPVCDACCTGFVGNNDSYRPAENLARVEYIVNLLVLEQTVCMYARTGGVEILTNQGIVLGNMYIELPLKISAHLCNGLCIYTIISPPQGNAFY